MRIHNKLLILSLFISAQLLAAEGNPLSSNPVTKDKTAISFSDIFYSDYENTTLFIDFETLGNQFSELNILRSNDLMMQDDIRDLDTTTIYEINLEVFRAGTYTLELKTPDGIKIHKEFVIN